MRFVFPALFLLLAPTAAARTAHLDVHLAAGEPAAVHVLGRVLAGSPPPADQPADRPLVNLLRLVVLIADDEIPGAAVVAVDPDDPERELARGVTDAEGFFHLVVDGSGAAGESLDLVLRLEHPRFRAPAVSVEARLLPAEGARVVVTDFDDTLAVSEVTRPLRFVLRTVVTNAAQTVVVDGAPACLRGLAARADAVVVLSASPVNLFRRLARFLEVHDFPDAGFVLRDFGIGPEADPLDPARFKREALARLADWFPHARFVLVGDSSERDGEAYAAFRDEHADRVERIFIRETGVRSVWGAEVPADLERFRDFAELGGGCSEAASPLE